MFKIMLATYYWENFTFSLYLHIPAVSKKRIKAMHYKLEKYGRKPKESGQFFLSFFAHIYFMHFEIAWTFPLTSFRLVIILLNRFILA